MKRFSFKKTTAEKYLNNSPKELFCTFDTNQAIITLRKFVKELLVQDSKESLLQILLERNTTADELTYAIPCLCEVRYTVKTDEKSFAFTRHCVVYGVTEYDVDAALDTLIQLELEDMSERIGKHPAIQYKVLTIIPCIG